MKSSTKCHCCDEGIYISMSDVHDKYLQIAQSKQTDPLNQRDINKEDNYNNCCLIEISRNHDIVTPQEDLVDSYFCSMTDCKHIYRDYYEDISDFHAGEYRQDQIMGDNLLDMGDRNRWQMRIDRCNRQLNMVSGFIDENDKCLELAVGRGYMLSVAKKYFTDMNGVDIDPKTIEHNKITNPEVNLILANILDLPEDTKYDVLIAMDVLEHVEDLNGFINKIYNITNKYIILQVPVDRPLIPPNFHLLKNPKRHQTKFDGHLHYFTKLSILKLFTKNNLFKSKFMYKSVPGELAGGPELLCVFEVNK